MKNTMKMLVIGIAAVILLLAVGTVRAQERVRSITMTNTAIGTAYFASGGSNVVTGPGLISYVGGTTNFTLTSAQTLTSAANGVPFYVGNMWNAPFWWQMNSYAANTGTSNTSCYIDLSPDGSVWISQALTNTVAQAGTGTNTVSEYYPYINGTNVLSGYLWARWSGATTTQTNNVTLTKNQINQFR